MALREKPIEPTPTENLEASDKTKMKVRKNACFQKVGCIQNALHPLDRQGFWNITKNIFAENYRIPSLRD